MDSAGAIKQILNRLESDLPNHLYYHGHHHTLDVLESVERIGNSEGVSEQELNLLLVAAAYHDCGFLNGHQDHEQKGCEIARENLPNFGFDSAAIERVCKMILATKVPQDPSGHLADILCDADLDYLGRDDFEPIGSNLFKELSYLGIVTEIETWNKIQVNFLGLHKYHTTYGRKFRQPQKEIHLANLEKIVSGYDD
jgi:predicted metal-dependent HD superfamily phosphohydrolase